MMSFFASRLFYILFGLLVVGLAIFDYFLKRKKITQIAFIIVLVVYVIFASIRSSNVGLDTSVYSETYEACKNLNQAKIIIGNNKPEYLFYSLVTLFSGVFNVSEVVFRFFYYSIIATCIFFSFRKLEFSMFAFALFLFLGFFNMSFSGIRQTMSMALMTLAISWLLYPEWNIKKKIILYYALNIVSIGFHSSSLIMLLVPLIFMIPVTKKNFIFLLPLLLFIPMVIKKGVYLASFYTYVAYGFGTYKISITFILTLMLLIIYYLFVGCPKISDWLNNKLKFLSFDYKGIDSKNILLVFVSLSFMACNSFSLVLPRYSMYFYLGVSCFVMHFFICFKNIKLKTLSYCAILGIFFIYFIYSVPALGLVPYAIR